jgi:DNA replication protein DnaC
MTCKLKETLHKEFINDNGISKIRYDWDHEAVRDCPDCGGLKYIQSVNPQGYRMVAPCEGTSAIRRIELYNQAGVPARHGCCTFQSFNLKELRDGTEVESFIRSIRKFQKGDPGFLLEGGSGTGKTHLLCAAIRYLTLERGISCMYVDYSNLLNDIRNAYGQNIPESSYIDPLVKAPVLFLDEVGRGREKTNDFEIRIIDTIINQRYLNPDLTTYFASNYRDRASSGYLNYIANGYAGDKRRWQQFAQQRYRAEGFQHVDEFYQYVDKLMKSEHIEDRISERTASRLIGMVTPVYIDASDYRRKCTK